MRSVSTLSSIVPPRAGRDRGLQRVDGQGAVVEHLAHTVEGDTGHVTRLVLWAGAARTPTLRRLWRHRCR
jgi:hypothetical protein